MANKRHSVRVRFGAQLPVHADRGTEEAIHDSFQLVEARNLSQTGISFYCFSAPDEPLLVVHLGSPAIPLFMLARITRCVKDYQDAQRRFLVACEFVKVLKVGASDEPVAT